MRRLVRFILTVAAIAAIVYALRDRLAPTPEPPLTRPPELRTPPAPNRRPQPATTQPATPRPATPQPVQVEASPELLEEPDAPSIAAPAVTVHAADDLTAISGIGPVYAARLADEGITTFAALAAADPVELAERIDVAPTQVASWAAQAASLLG